MVVVRLIDDMKLGDFFSSVADSMSVPTSKFIKSACVYLDGSAVKVECVFEDEEEGVSCVLVYREYGSETITVEEHHKNNTFPKSVDISDPAKYTFAVFGKRGYTIDERPIMSGRAVPATTSPVSGGTTSPSSGVVAGVSVAIILVACGIIVVVVVMWRQKKTSRKYTPPLSVVPSPSCLDVESGCGGQNGSSDSKTPHSCATQSKEETKYGTVVTSKSGNRFHYPTVEYAKLDIRATHKMARFDMTPSTGNRSAIDVAKTEFPYVDVKLPNPTTVISPSAGSEDKTTEKITAIQTKSQGPPTVKAVMSLLYCAREKWREMDLGVDEDLIDEININNQTDEACLQDCVQQWVSRLGPSWEELSHVLRDLGEESLAQQAWSGVSAEEGAESSECIEEAYGEGSHEVVTGTREDTPFSDTSSDDTRHANGECFGSPVTEECQENYHHFSVSSGDQASLPAPDTAKDTQGSFLEVEEELRYYGFIGGDPEELQQCTDRNQLSLDVHVEEIGSTTPPPTQPTTLPPRNNMEMKETETKNTLPFLSHSENYKEKAVKWLCTGIALGFHGSDSDLDLSNSALGARQSGDCNLV